MTVKLKIEEKYEMRIGNEVGFISDILKIGHNNFFYKVEPEFNQPVINLLNQVVNASYCMRIVYLVNLFDSFMQEYICFKDRLNIVEMDNSNYLSNHLKYINEKWNNFVKESTNYYTINKSTSFMNIRYSLFVLKEKYNIRFPSNLCSAIPELGSLRNCIVHHNCDIFTKDKGGRLFTETMKESLKTLTIINSKVILTDEFVNTVTYDLQAFVASIGGRLYKNMEYNDSNF